MPDQARLSILWRKWRSFWKFPLLDKMVIPIVFILLGLARIIILAVPFRYYANLLGQYRRTEIFTPVLATPQIEWARRIGRIVRATAKITPWESLCLVQALVASVLLRTMKLPYILHFGLAKNIDTEDIEPMKAHAWVTAGCVAVTGGRSLFKFTVVGSYVAPYLNEDVTSLVDV